MFWESAMISLAKLAALVGLVIGGLTMSSLVPSALAQKRGREPAVRAVQGIVTDDAGKPASGAIVQLKNTKTLQVISFITRDQGDYYFHGLSPDIDFELTAEKEGKVSSTRTLSSFDSRKQAIINIKIDKPKPSK
jgi:hypothetical protein